MPFAMEKLVNYRASHFGWIMCSSGALWWRFKGTGPFALVGKDKGKLILHSGKVGIRLK